MSTRTVWNRDHTRWAVFSECGLYRYELGVELPPNLFATKGPLGFLMCNPSVAGHPSKIHGELRLDNTVTLCCETAANLWHSGVRIYNLAALVATDPEQMTLVQDPIGPENDVFLRKLRDSGAPIVCAFGCHPIAVARALDVIPKLGGEYYCLGLTAYGWPHHPLRLRKITELQSWRIPA